MPNWKKLVVSGSDASLNNLNVNNAVTASFFTGDGSNLFNLTVNQAATVTLDFVNQSSVTVTHNFNSKNIVVAVYDSNDLQVIPESVRLTNFDSITVTFPSAISGRIVVAKGGHIVSGSSDFDLLVNKPTLVSSSVQLASDISGSITAFSSSITLRTTELENFSSSLNATFATDAELSAVSSSIASDLVTNYLRNTTDTLDGDLTVTGIITAQEFHTEYVSASIIYQSGSTQFGDSLDDTHIFTGSINLTGSLFINGSEVGTGKLDETVFNAYTSSTDTRIETLENSGLISSSAQIAAFGYLTSSSLGLNTKVGFVPSSSFIDIGFGGVGVASVVFATPFSSSDYSVAVSSINSFEPGNFKISHKTPTGFVISGSSGFIGLLNDGTDSGVNYIAVANGETAVTSSFTLLSATASYVEYGNVANKPTLLSGSNQIASDISGSFTLVSSSIASDITDIIDGTTTVTSASYALTASYALNAGGADTGSLLATASAAGSTITFEKGDGSTFDVTVSATATPANALVTASLAGSTLTFEKGDTSTFSIVLPAGGGGGYTGESATAILSQSVAADTWSFAHNLNERHPVITVYDDNEDVIVPNVISTVDENNLEIVFSTARTGYATAVVVGVSSSYAATASYSDIFVVSQSLTTNGYTFPLTDGVDGQVIITDGSGVLTFDDVKVYAQVKNISGGTLLKGTPVHATASASPPAGNLTEVILAQAGVPSTMPATFILDEDLNDTQEGRAISVGYINGVDTSGFTVGDVVYVGPNGGYTNVKPTGSNLIQNLGVVTRVDASNGSGFIYGSGRSNDIPNIPSGYAWVGNGSQVATAVPTASFYVNNAVTASYALNAGGGTGVGFPFSGSAIITGSLFVSGSSISGSFVGDGSGLTGIDVGAIASVSQTFTNVTSSIVSHNFNSKDVNVAVYNGLDQYIIPDTITLTDNNTVTVLFAVPTSGRIVVSKGGHILSGLGLTSKAGCILTSSFSATGSSFYYDVNFTSNFDTTNYSVTLQAHSQYAVPDSFPGHAWVDSNKSTSGFRIVVPSFDDTMDEICWTAIAHGESDVTASHAATATSASYALTASYALNAGGGSGAGFPYSGSAFITGSLIVSSSFVDFTNATVISGSIFSGSFVGDGTGLSGLGYGDTKKLNQTVAATTWSFSHNMNEQYPTVTVYNSVNEVIQPSKIEAVDAQTLRLYFGIPVAGTAVAVVGGVALTQEAGFNRVLSQTVAATTWSFEHNLGNKYPQVAVYDASDELVIPGKLEAIDQNNLTIYFDTPQAGTATATVGGTSLTASYANSLVITDTLLTTQENTDVDTGTETVATVSTTLYDGAFFDYVLKDGTNYRAGTVSAVWDGSSVQFSEISTADIGNTNSVTMSVDISGTDARLRATVGSDNWNIKAFVRAL